ncbi:MAG: hypothetical protein H6741_02465 [Alphaproteobacteria bacterium]|nr:hypothetical protein [Alphaproteobacteria bacterium]MCB9791568.1 hypothetical protein [Alphaproteobacteria bacterium]
MPAESAPLTPVLDGVHLASEPVRILGMGLSSNMTVLRLPSGGLLLHSPVPMTPARRAAVHALGPVRHLYAPNSFHHLWLAEWAAAYPEAQVHAPSALVEKHPGLRIDRAHDLEPGPDFEGAIHEQPIRGFRLQEGALLHGPSSALVVADLVHNIGRPPGAWTQAYTRAMGFWDRPAISRMIRWTAFDDRAAARESVDALLERGFEHLLVGHGAPLLQLGAPALAEACAWLRPAAPSRLPARASGACG